MKQYIELNNKTFEVKKLKHEVCPLKYRTLNDCYVKPSSIKREIYDDWRKWFLELKDEANSDYGYGIFTILSYNVRFFTIGIEVYNKVDELIGYLYITKTRQEFWKLV